MAKKKAKSNTRKILGLIGAILGIVAICMIFVETVKVPDTKVLGNVIEGEGYTGLKVVFGFKSDDVAVFGFSFMALLTYLLMILGVALSISSYKAKKNNKVFDVFAVALFVVAGVFCFLMPGFVVGADTILGKVVNEVDYTLAIGGIVSAVASILAALCMSVKVITSK